MKRKNTKKMALSGAFAGSNLFPAFFNLRDKRCVVAGGGAVAQRKISRLLECGARVVVVSPAATRRIAAWASRRRITWHRKPWNARYLAGAFLVFAATDDAGVNRAVALRCRQRAIAVNVADDPELCDFMMPASFRRGPLGIAVSTGGASPAFAGRLCRVLGQALTDAHGELLNRLGEVRRSLKRMLPDARQRRKIFQTMADSDILPPPAAGQKAASEKRDQECILSSRD